MNYFYVIVSIGFVIFIHECGHFFAARLVNIPIKIFSIGFGPKIAGFSRKGTEYRISLVPLGGYVLPAISNEHDFFNFPVSKRIIMSAGGPLASLALPFFCFVFLNSVSGELSTYGILLKPFKQTFVMLSNFIMTVPKLFSDTGNLSGVVGIVSQGGHYIDSNYLNIIKFTALLSMNFFVLNMLPFPVLDGGKIVLYLSEKIHPKLVKLHLPLSIIGWLFLIGLMVYVTVLDIGKIV